MNGRIYDGALGRFVQADPIIRDPLRVQSLNRYSYVWNNPLNATDSSGFMMVNTSYWREDRVELPFEFVNSSVNANSRKNKIQQPRKNNDGVPLNSYSSIDGSVKISPEAEKLWGELVQTSKNSVAEVSAKAHEEANDDAIPERSPPTISDYDELMGERYSRYHRERSAKGKEAAETGSVITEAILPIGSPVKKVQVAEKIVKALQKEEKVADSLYVTSDSR